jgi:L-seryl-tRNA(Ser) seleniumtransferase
MKVGREEIVGLLVALQRFVAGSDEADLERMQQLLDPIEAALSDVPGVTVTRHVPASKPVPGLRVTICSGDVAERAYAVVNRLLDGEPSIAIDQSHAEFGRLAVIPQGVTSEEAETIAARLRKEFFAVVS